MDINADILLVVDYETGEVYDEFTVDAGWADMNGTKEQQIFYMLNGALVGGDYEGGTVIVDTETRTELSEKGIAKNNESIRNYGSTAETSNDDTQKQEVKGTESVEQTVEITLDNWQEYFEIRPSAKGCSITVLMNLNVLIM